MKKLLALILLSTSLEVSAGLVLSEGFDDISTLFTAGGWVQKNNTASLSPTLPEWFQGNSGIFQSQAGAPDAYIANNFLSADLGPNISHWLFSPVLTLGNNDTIEFYTRTTTDSLFADRLELRLSTNGASTDVGVTDTSVGDFTTLLLTINPALDPGGYPDDWALFSVTLSGLGGPFSGRFAFRYNVPDASTNADYIGIDTVLVTSVVPEPPVLALGAFGLVLLGFARRRGLRA